MSITARGASAGTVAAPACARTAASEHQGEVHRVQGAPLKSKLRHYVNLHVMEKKLGYLMSDYNWGTMHEAYKDVIDAK